MCGLDEHEPGRWTRCAGADAVWCSGLSLTVACLEERRRSVAQHHQNDDSQTKSFEQFAGLVATYCGPEWSNCGPSAHHRTVRPLPKLAFERSRKEVVQEVVS